MKTLAVTLLGVGLSVAAFAQQPAESPPGPVAQSAPQPFEVTDKNADGKVSRDEASTVQGLDFAAADANRDSMLDRPEYMAAIAKIPRQRG